MGKRTALALSDDGYAVVVAGRRPVALESAVADAGTDDGSVIGVPTDVTDVESVQSLFAAHP